MYREGKYKSPFLSTVETVLNGIGLSGMWTPQFDSNYSNQWFKSKVTRYEISISNSGPQNLNQKKYITIIKCLKTCLYLKIICKFYRLT